MRRILIHIYCISFFSIIPVVALASNDTSDKDALSRQVQELQSMVIEMKNDYEARINEMQDKIARLEGKDSKAVDDDSLKKELVQLLDEEGYQPASPYTPGYPSGGKWQNLMLDIGIIGDSLANVTWPERSIDEGRAGSPFAENEFSDT